MKLGVVCGFKAEEETFHKIVRVEGLTFNYVVRCSGSSAERAFNLSKQMVADGCTALLSFGVAGGLKADATPGTVIFSTHVVTLESEAFGQAPEKTPTSLKLKSAGALKKGTICGVDKILFSPLEKADVFIKSNADIADMESHSVAKAATQAHIPFYALRAVSDGQADSLPQFVASAVSEEGTPRLGPVLLGLLKNPLVLPKLLRLKTNTDLALEGLTKSSPAVLRMMTKQI